MQFKLHPMLNDVISLEQTVVLPLRFILDNVVNINLMYETLHWAKTSKTRLLKCVQ